MNYIYYLAGLALLLAIWMWFDLCKYFFYSRKRLGKFKYKIAIRYHWLKKIVMFLLVLGILSSMLLIQDARLLRAAQYMVQGYAICCAKDVLVVLMLALYTLRVLFDLFGKVAAYEGGISFYYATYKWQDIKFFSAEGKDIVLGLQKRRFLGPKGIRIAISENQKEAFILLLLKHGIQEEGKIDEN